MQPGERVGVLLWRDDDGDWRSGLCQQVDPRQLREVGPGRPPSVDTEPDAKPAVRTETGRRVPQADEGRAWAVGGAFGAAVALGAAGIVVGVRRSRRSAT
jgi:hypothetical protein